MDYNAAFQISASGMALERLRMDVTAANIANMHVAAATPAETYRPLTVVGAANPLSFSQQFGRLLGGGTRIVGAVPQTAAPRMVYEPGHPYADVKGFVSYPGVNHTGEMLNLTVAVRAYEANVAAMNAAKAMATRTLEIGGQQ